LRLVDVRFLVLNDNRGMAFRLKFWGVRGSLPTAPDGLAMRAHFKRLMNSFLSSPFARNQDGIDKFFATLSPVELQGFGGETTCVQVIGDQSDLLVDAGSGLRRFGERIKNSAVKPKKFHILLTHFHWDHLLGLPFFFPIFDPRFKVHFYSPEQALEQLIAVKFQKPFFPVPFDVVRKQMIFHYLPPRVTTQIGEWTVTPYLLDHPDPCWGYKIQKGQLAYSHCVDTEANRTSREELGEDLPLYQKTTLMYFDAQYSLPELVEKSNWGHSAAQIGLDIALREQIPFVVFGHHDPGASYSQIMRIQHEVRRYQHWKKQSARNNRAELFVVRWRFAYDGMTVDLNQLIPDRRIKTD
jgi:phosphoribosyl 1,2-cyclic phosphodiesterase